MQSDHWRLLKKKIANIQGVASLNIKNRQDRREIQSLIISRFATHESVTTLLNSSPVFSKEKTTTPSPSLHTSHVVFSKEKTKDHINESGLEMAKHVCNLLYTPNLILGSDSLEKMAHLSHQLNQDSNLIFMGGWDRDHLINHLDSLKLQEIPREIWKEGLCFFSLFYGRPCFFLGSLLERNKRNFLFLLKEYRDRLATRLKEETDPVFSK